MPKLWCSTFNMNFHLVPCGACYCSKFSVPTDPDWVVCTLCNTRFYCSLGCQRVDRRIHMKYCGIADDLNNIYNEERSVRAYHFRYRDLLKTFAFSQLRVDQWLWERPINRPGWLSVCESKILFGTLRPSDPSLPGRWNDLRFFTATVESINILSPSARRDIRQTMRLPGLFPAVGVVYKVIPAIDTYHFQGNQSYYFVARMWGIVCPANLAEHSGLQHPDLSRIIAYQQHQFKQYAMNSIDGA